MSTPSNLYAEKIFSEHPLALWALDDTANYISFLDSSDRNIASTWTLNDCTVVQETSISSQPFKNTPLFLLSGNVPSGPTQTYKIVSSSLVNFSNLNTNFNTFSVGAYIYSSSPYIQSVEIGYEYIDTITAELVTLTKTFETTIYQKWFFVSESFELPNSQNTGLKAVIKINVYEGGTNSGDYQFYINGVTAGQWAEEFHVTSLGANPITIPTDVSLFGGLPAVEALTYGISQDSGYYLVNDNALMARNTSIPLVYGASGITKLIPWDTGQPSVIIPGKGFLNKVGQYKDYTVEFWAKINCNSTEPRRIFGPIASTDGLYVESGFLTLVIGSKFASYFVGEWLRPMLIHIKVGKNFASVMLNGDEVISLSIITSDLNLPSEYDINNKNQDWLGFYSYTDVDNFEIDCISIYPYQVSSIIAKRRLVYGQAVVSPENIDSGYNGSSAFIDYPFADYTANYRYPDMARWDQGVFDNLTVTSTSLKTPNYQLPEIFLSDKTLQNLYNDNQSIQTEANKFITFRPNSTWNNTQCYFNFPKLNILNDEIHVLYAVIKIKEDDLTEQTIIQLYNTITGNYFSVRKDGPEIHYYLHYNGIEEELYITDPFVVNDIILVGIDIEGMAESFGGNVATFFGNRNGMKIYIGGDESGIRTFTGNIYSVGLSTSFNESKLENYFYGGGIYGIAELTAGPNLINYLASYTLLPLEKYSTYFLDIGISGYWEDYIPLSYFGQFVSNDNGEQYYDLDFLQVNLGYPQPSESQEVISQQSWTYHELLDYFANPIQATYAQLDNYLYTNWENYEQLETKASSIREFNTTDSLVRSYITLQYILDGSNALQDYFSTTVAPTEESVIDISKYPNWNTTKFEIINNSLIYPTKSVNFENLSLVSHLEFNVRGILSKPVEIKNFEISSQALNNNTFTSIGTRFGINMYPYTKSGFYYDYKTKNPFSIYKGSTPYLYLTKNSGIEVRGQFEPQLERGIAIPINKSLATDYKVSAMQMWIRYDKHQFPGSATPFFNINYKSDTIDFYFVSNNSTGTRAKIYAKSRNTGQDFDGISYYLNGSLVREPVITIKEWAALGIGFSSSISFDAIIGNINLTSPFIFNNISYYKATNLQQIQSGINRSWLRVKETPEESLYWEYWLNNYIWRGVLVAKTTDIYGINPTSVYSAYLGTNKIIIDDDKGILVTPENVLIYNDLTWQSSVKNPV